MLGVIDIFAIPILIYTLYQKIKFAQQEFMSIGKDQDDKVLSYFIQWRDHKIIKCASSFKIRRIPRSGSFLFRSHVEEMESSCSLCAIAYKKPMVSMSRGDLDLREGADMEEVDTGMSASATHADIQDR
jgi:hypothetical protein